MNRLAYLLAVAALALAVPATAQETADVSGEWEITSETPRGTQTRVITFEQDGSTLTGTMETRMGTMPIQDGSVTGSDFTFTMVFTRGERSMEITYSGTVEGDEMTGKMVTPRGEVPFTGKRKAGE